MIELIERLLVWIGEAWPLIIQSDPHDASTWQILFKEVFPRIGSAFVAVLGLYKSAAWVVRYSQAMALAKKIQASSFYTELDRCYADILRLAIEHPHLRQPREIGLDQDALQAVYDPYPELPVSTSAQRVEKDDKCAQYDAYAFMVWNFLETIHDRCAEYEGELLDTWATIVAAENRIHRGWFLKQMRDEWIKSKVDGHVPSDKFCKNFRVFVFDRNFLPDNADAEIYMYSQWSYEGRGKFKVPPPFA